MKTYLYKFNFPLYFVVLSLSFFIFNPVAGQDAVFSQWFNNTIYYNPAYSGLMKGARVKMNYRKQWADVPGFFNNYTFSFDFAERSLPGAGGLGVIINSTREGLGNYHNFTAGIMPSVRVILAEKFVLQAAPLVAFVRKQIDLDNLVFEGQIDEIHGNIYPTSYGLPVNEYISYPDFGFGLVFQIDADNVVATFGGSGNHLARPNQSFYKKTAPLHRMYVAHADVVFEVRESTGYYTEKINFKFNPGVLFQHQANMSLYSIGMNLYFSNIYAGMWYRNESLEYDTHSDLIVVAGLLIPFGERGRLKLVYSYDIQVTSDQAFTGPSHEISLVFEIDDFRLVNKSNTLYRFKGRNLPDKGLDCSPF